MQFLSVGQRNTKIILSLLIAAVIFVIAFRDILLAIISYWAGNDSAAYNHGPLVVACSIYLLVAKRAQISKLNASPKPIGFLLLVSLLIAMFFSELVEINTIQMLALPLLILVLIFITGGKQYLKLVALPIAILFFAIPIWSPLVPLLQDITTWVTAFNLNVLDRPVYVVGNYLNITGGVFLIEEGCSGLRFLLIAIILSLINTDLNGFNLKQGSFLLLVAVGLALLANWLRVIIIVVLGDMTNMQHKLVSDHANFGWLIFLFVVLIPFLLISRMMQRHDAEVVKDATTAPTSAPAVRYFVLAMLMFIAMPFLRYGHAALLEHNNDQQIELPGTFADWSDNNTVLRNGSWKPGYKNASREMFKSYSEDSGVEVDLYLFHYSEQEQGAELINIQNRIADGEVWTIVPSSEGQRSIPGGQNITQVNEAEVVSNSNERKLVWYWYDIGGHITSSQFNAKLFQILAQLRGVTYGNLVAVSISCKPGCEDGQQYLERYLLDWQRLEI